ncbi:hypothetical protein [Actinomadura vinacea]
MNPEPNTPSDPLHRPPDEDRRVAGRPAGVPEASAEQTAPDAHVPGEELAGPPPASAAPPGAPEPEAREPANHRAGVSEPTDHGPAGHLERLLDAGAADRFRRRWREIQTDFVDDPVRAVHGADELAAEVVNAIGRALADRKRALEESQPADADGAPGTAPGTAPDTERLRQALRGYRELVDRLLDT